ncbi:polysaccharide biosynthesis/export family protein [Luteolibacter yonseiensis]|uniref:Polysaccharide biosynthesis/export family protein n=1 Tax=Luteolibacter yonseiensis TaxID=1144680 RepID=A0A934R6M0_9BACT|nr:polysaccharide biosynthesis/export family protein [Luteolibacter yonseiensis]MBK1817962.1 polysaccharide biosynthesis/export family protein [Luteolibacter yonseiensis]
MKRVFSVALLHLMSLGVTMGGDTGSPEPSAPPSAPEAPAGKGNAPGNMAKLSPISWRTRYELGPGDVINFALFGRPELDRPGFRIAPDGTISFLQAQNIKVAGLTIDEARLAIEQGLTSNFRSPRVIITPQEIASKRFTIMGKVLDRGIVTLERPITLVEAIANAGGIETGLYEQNTVELADLDRSFVSRNGQQLKINFKQLLRDGDMSQNVEIEPNDFIYLASTISNSYYVLGAVGNPGVQGLTADASVVSAVSRRSGFTDRAWTDRVLVVRGSFSQPQTFVVSVKDILAAKIPDFKLQPKDIVYVADRPWATAEDIMKLAFAAFVSSATTNWVDLNVDPIIKN